MMDKVQKKIAQNLYGTVANHVAQFIDEFNVDTRKPLQWDGLTEKKRAFWCKEAEKLGYRKPKGKPLLLHADGCTTNLGVIGASCNCGTEAQRDSDVKWYGGEE